MSYKTPQTSEVTQALNRGATALVRDIKEDRNVWHGLATKLVFSLVRDHQAEEAARGERARIFHPSLSELQPVGLDTAQSILKKAEEIFSQFDRNADGAKALSAHLESMASARVKFLRDIQKGSTPPSIPMG